MPHLFLSVHRRRCSPFTTLLTAAALAAVLFVGAAPAAADAPARGYAQRACGFDMDRDGIVGEPEDCNVCDGTVDDGDPVDSLADVIYVSCAAEVVAGQPAGSDHAGCGAPGDPCATIGYAFGTIADGPSDGAEDIVCFRNTCIEENLTPREGYGGVTGTYLQSASGSATRDWHLPTDPVMLVGWDVDNDGVYPPMDADHTAILAPPETCPGTPNAACTAAPILNPTDSRQRFHQKLDERAIYLANGLDHIEMAHFTARDYGRHTLTWNSGFFDLHQHPLGTKPDNPSEYIYLHDIEATDINRDSNYNSRSSAINSFNWQTHYLLFENVSFTDNGHWFSRGGGTYGPSEYGPIRWRNLTLTLDACKPPTASTCDPDTDPTCPQGNVCLSATGNCEPGPSDTCDTRTSTSWKMWGYYTGVDILDSVIDANTLNAPNPTSDGKARGVDIAQCSQDWVVRNNALLDFNSAIEVNPVSNGACDGNKDGGGLITTLYARPVTDLLFAENDIRHEAPTGILDVGISLKPGGDQYPNQVIGDVTIRNNTITSLDGLETCIEVRSGHGWDGSDPAYPVAAVPGTVRILHNTCYSPITQQGAIRIGHPFGSNQTTMQQDLVVRNNLVGGKGTSAANIAVSYAPTNFVAGGNAWDPDGDFRWNTATDTRIDFATWNTTVGDTGAGECVPLLETTSGTLSTGDPAPVDGDVHLHPADLCARERGADPSIGSSGSAVAIDIDVEARPYATGWDAGADEVLPRPLTEPPLRYHLAPDGVLAYGTTGTTLTLSTDQNANCSYATSAGVPYGDASRVAFTATAGGTQHSVAVTGLTSGGSYAYYVRCENTGAVANADDATIAFDVAGLDVGLVGRWTFDDGSGCTAADAAGSHDGTLEPGCSGNAPSWVAGEIGTGALDFDGVDDYVEVSHASALTLTGSLTISAWIRADDFGDSKYGRIVAKQKYVGGFGGGYSFYMGDVASGNPPGTDTVCANIGTASFGCATNGSISLNTWHHVVMVYDDASSEVRFYVDGSAAGSFSTSSGPGSNTVPLRIGDRDDLKRSFDGEIDDVRLWSRALSATEIADLATGI
ncbi:MAG: LamG domain-containing protein [Acidobacteriota bacterium]